jgi:hypothetical protein
MTSAHKFLMLGSLLAVLGGGGWFALQRPAEVAAEPLPVPVAVVDDGLSARAVAEHFTGATTQEERLKWVRQPEAVAPAMERFFSSGKGSGEAVAKLDGIAPGNLDESIHERFAVTMADGTRRLLCLLPTAGGVRVDFKAYARHGSVAWTDLLGGQAAEADEMRVFLEKGDYYNFGFKHEVRWQCFTVTSPDLELPVWVYLARNDPAHRLLQAAYGPKPVRVTLALRSVGDSHLRRQFEIIAVHAADWVIPE